MVKVQRWRKGGAADGAAELEVEDSAADSLHSEDKGRRCALCCGSRGQCGGWPAQGGHRTVRQMASIEEGSKGECCDV